MNGFQLEHFEGANEWCHVQVPDAVSACYKHYEAGKGKLEDGADIRLPGREALLNLVRSAVHSVIYALNGCRELPTGTASVPNDVESIASVLRLLVDGSETAKKDSAVDALPTPEVCALLLQIVHGSLLSARLFAMQVAKLAANLPGTSSPGAELLLTNADVIRKMASFAAGSVSPRALITDTVVAVFQLAGRLRPPGFSAVPTVSRAEQLENAGLPPRARSRFIGGSSGAAARGGTTVDATQVELRRKSVINDSAGSDTSLRSAIKDAAEELRKMSPDRLEWTTPSVGDTEKDQEENSAPVAPPKATASATRPDASIFSERSDKQHATSAGGVRTDMTATLAIPSCDHDGEKRLSEVTSALDILKTRAEWRVFNQRIVAVSQALMGAGENCVQAAVAELCVAPIADLAFQQVVSLCVKDCAQLAASVQSCLMEPLLAYCCDAVALLRTELFKLKDGVDGDTMSDAVNFDVSDFYVHGAALKEMLSVLKLVVEDSEKRCHHDGDAAVVAEAPLVLLLNRILVEASPCAERRAPHVRTRAFMIACADSEGMRSAPG